MPGTLYIFRGLPASGKSTIAAAMDECFALDMVVCRDDIRQERGFNERWEFGKPTDEQVQQENEVRLIRDTRILEGLRDGKRVGCSDTNLSGGTFAHLERLARSIGAEVITITIDAPLELCCQRDTDREDGNPSVGRPVIARMSGETFVQKFLCVSNKGEIRWAVADTYAEALKEGERAQRLFVQERKAQATMKVLDDNGVLQLDGASLPSSELLRYNGPLQIIEVMVRRKDVANLDVALQPDHTGVVLNLMMRRAELPLR